MSLDFDHRTSGPAHHVLAGGSVITLRTARSRDLDALRSLAVAAGVVCEELELARLVRCDDQLVLCAVTAVDVVVGLGVIALDGWTTMPSLLLVESALGDGLGRVIADGLIERARELAAAGQVA